MSKQTAVEWLAFELLALFHVQIDSLMAQEVKGIFQQAKEMEKEQIMDACNAGLSGIPRSSKQYYNETYGGESKT